MLGNALLRASNQSVLHVCIIVYSSQSVYCSFITCCLTVNIVGQHLATYFAEWQKANTLMSCSTYAGNVGIEQLNCFVFFYYEINQTRVALIWVQSVFLCHQSKFTRSLYLQGTNALKCLIYRIRK